MWDLVELRGVRIESGVVDAWECSEFQERVKVEVEGWWWSWRLNSENVNFKRDEWGCGESDGKWICDFFEWVYRICNFSFMKII